MEGQTRRGHGSRFAVAEIAVGQGRLGISACPGPGDLDAVAAWADAVVTFATGAELERLGVPLLGNELVRRGLAWMHAPIGDFGVPSAELETTWVEHGRLVRVALRQGKQVLFHCRAGLGRSGMMAARTLVELGWPPARAIAEVRQARPGAIETPEQEAVVRRARAAEDGGAGD